MAGNTRYARTLQNDARTSLATPTGEKRTRTAQGRTWLEEVELERSSGGRLGGPAYCHNVLAVPCNGYTSDFVKSVSKQKEVKTVWITIQTLMGRKQYKSTYIEGNKYNIQLITSCMPAPFQL